MFKIISDWATLAWASLVATWEALFDNDDDDDWPGPNMPSLSLIQLESSRS